MLAAREPYEFFGLENPVDLRRLSAPMTVLEGLQGRVVIGEAQHRPDLCKLLRVLVDRMHNSARFLLAGSASLSLVKGVSESLPGSIGFVDVGGLDLRETSTGSARSSPDPRGIPSLLQIGSSIPACAYTGSPCSLDNRALAA